MSLPREKLRINCCDLPQGYEFSNHIFKLIEQLCDVEVSDDPEVVLYGPWGAEFQKYKCLRIYYTGENTRPNFKQCDYAFSFDYSNNSRNYRFPDYAGYADVTLLTRAKDIGEIARSKTKFCNFVYSNPMAPTRIRFFKALSEYRRVDSFGKVLNNMPKGGQSETGNDWMVTKLASLGDYKFTIAFENESYSGYVTEKIIHPMLANSIPIYWGNPLIHKDFNTKSFINCHDYPNFAEVIKRVIEIDNNDEIYQRMLAEPWYMGNKVPDSVREESILQRLKLIIDGRKQIEPVALQNLPTTRSEVRDSLWGRHSRITRLIYKWKLKYYSKKYVSDNA